MPYRAVDIEVGPTSDAAQKLSDKYLQSAAALVNAVAAVEQMDLNGGNGVERTADAINKLNTQISAALKPAYDGFFVLTDGSGYIPITGGNHIGNGVGCVTQNGSPVPWTYEYVEDGQTMTVNGTFVLRIDQVS